MSIERRDMEQSRYGESRTAAFRTGVQELPLVSVRSEDGRARAWRVTLARLDRKDTRAHLATGALPSLSVGVFEASQYGYDAGFQNAPAIPPVRSNPVIAAAGPGSFPPPTTPPSAMEFVEVKWGTEQSSQFLLANWPAQGASFTVWGSFVYVWGGAQLFNLDGVTDAELPTFQAQAVPDNGGTFSTDDELSIQQAVIVDPLVPGSDAVPALVETAADFHAATTAGPPAVGPAGVPVVLDAVGSPAWTATVAFLTAGLVGNGKTLSLCVLNSGAFPALDVRPDQWFDPVGGVWGPMPGNLGCLIDLAPSTTTVADLEAAIDASGFAAVIVPDVAHAAETFADMNGGGNDRNQIATFAGGVASVCATQGAAVYVPDFARRVRVTLTRFDESFCGVELRAPLTGNIPCQLVWYDDSGNVVDAAVQGLVAAGAVEPVLWHPVPARGVLLGIYGPPAEEAITALVHWRVAP